MASGWNLWVWLVSVVVRRYIIDIHILITFPYSTCISSFLATSLFLVHFKNIFSFLYIYIVESVDSINRGERGFPLTQYITNGGISRARYTITILNTTIVSCGRFPIE